MTPTIVRSTTAEQCDKCGARAKVVAYFLLGELYFCLHHANEYKIFEETTAHFIVDGE